MVDVSAPLQPTFRGCYTDDVGLIAPGRTHDGQCVVYHGPDARYHDRQICIASNETALRFLDITRPDSVIEIAKATYPAAAYTHQGWLTEDHRYFFMNDELDELAGLATRTRTLIWDVSVLDDPVLVGEHLGPDGATDHNLFIRGDLLFEANYQAGVHILDIADPENPVPIGSFDTTPYEGNPPGFATGAWTAFPFLDSGTLVVTSMYEGVFLLRPRRLVP
ncbi:MAG: choice-of-anchor B family protein [Gemmatimonadetes bacterium]|nr:choice-of-anchor B family protein [Gemmatimonadota bacterium]NIQ58392.1 choice-of-anchor B family protein [Gemmatimonadota bacterium]NIU78606.1 choice-of-anchor B family protein [Gammaproteobacteria bacterium]NIX47449.1 choice-of-anchor B family protein [Gemmatimonadota bacterium]NIY11832.1 choice-of-anchor B family protein [Gemmatimonadota bacterium]